MLFGKKKDERQEMMPQQAHPAVEELMKKMNTLENIHATNMQPTVNMPEMQPVPARPVLQARTMPEEMPRKVDFPKQPTQEPEMKEEQRSSFAPLFVKIDRYRQILSTMNYLKNSMMLIKNNFVILNELEKLKEDNMKILQEGIERLEKKVVSLDTQFLRPSGFMEDVKETQDVEVFESTISDLSGQIQNLKAQLQSLV
jgi:polyhydroxyalkanoate synthesis regulator phasin